MLYGHFGLRTFRYQDTSAPKFGAEVSGHFGTDLYETLRPHCTKKSAIRISSYDEFPKCELILYRRSEIKVLYCTAQYWHFRFLSGEVSLSILT